MSPIEWAAGFQVTDEFITQLPQHLIVSSSHLQLLESIGEGKLLDLTWNLYVLDHIIYTRYMPFVAQAQPSISSLVVWKSNEMLGRAPCSLIPRPQLSVTSLAEYGKVAGWRRQ